MVGKWSKWFTAPTPSRPVPSVKPDSGIYLPFTTVFDEIIDADKIPAVLGNSLPGEVTSFEDAARRFDNEFQGERITIGAAAGRLVAHLHKELSGEQRSQTVVSFLIDHSGSMRGLRMLSALLAVEAATGALTQLNIKSEILGFTTTSWKGGKSRRSWVKAGKPRNPGRLCDLRHIIYSSADSINGFPWHVRHALRSDLLHENIDGEALEWAASRLDAIRWKNRIICIVSDGAPVDDSTLLANDNRNILIDHQKKVETELKQQGFVVGYLLVTDERYREPELIERAIEPEACALSLLMLVQRALTSALAAAPAAST